jgi:pilus assembly protein Flp/PilA
VRGFASDPSGATAIEYTLIGMLIGLVIIAALTTMGTEVNAMFAAVLPGLR